MSAPELLTDSPIDFAALVAQVATVEAGAIVTFSGTARRHSEGREVVELSYDGYRPMAAKVIGEILAEAAQQFAGARVAAIHRLGRCPLGEASVGVAAAAAHREQAFSVCRYVIDAIKARAPIWKQERFLDGTAWVGDPASYRERP